jgi:hypothetical protein
VTVTDEIRARAAELIAGALEQGGLGKAEAEQAATDAVAAGAGMLDSGVRAGWEETLHPRDKSGKFSRAPGVGALSGVYNEIPETRGIGRGKGTYTGPTGREQADLEKRGRQVPERVAEPITAKEARDASRPVTDAEFQALAREGVNRLGLLRAQRSPVTAMDRNWTGLKHAAYAESQKPWGGVTIDGHTGKTADFGKADKYALSVKKSGMHTVSVPEDASEEQFNAAMDRALAQFRGLLEGKQAYLGVFHDDEEHRIDIDPVLVVDSVREVEAIGAFSHAIGGAYHFRTGNGVFPPHVAGEAGQVAAEADGQTVHWAGIGQWHSEADRVQPGLSDEQDAEIDRAAQPQASEFPGQHYGQWRVFLTPVQAAAMRYYQSGFTLMNGQLRGAGTGDASGAELARAAKATRDLTAAIGKAPPLPADVTVYRRLSPGQFGDVRPGQVISDAGFTSVSLAADPLAEAEAAILLPAGTRAAAGEAGELILAPGSRFRVTAVARDGGGLWLELIPGGRG